MAIANFDTDARDGELDCRTLEWLIDPDGAIDPVEWQEFWDLYYGRGNPSASFILGFIEGATEVYDEIADKL